jgi:SPP1 family predicted phage head-tail adaptor
MSAGDSEHLAARLNERITIESPTLTSDGLGGNTESWGTVATTYAEVGVLFGAGREQVVAAQREARSAYRIVMRYRDGLSTKMRVLWNGKLLYVHGIASTRTITEITAYEGGES